MTLTGDQMAFLDRLSKSPDGRLLLSMYQADLAELDVKLRRLSGEALSQTQGRAQQLEEMIERFQGKTTKAVRVAVPRSVVSHGFST